MKKPIICLVVILLLLSGCGKSQTLPQETGDTMPTVQTQKSPLEILTEAAQKTQNDPELTAVYGRVVDDAEEKLDSGEGFITNESFLSDFCALRITASPSMDGMMRYTIDGLTRDELFALLYGEKTEGSAPFDSSQVLCAVTIEVNSDGYLSRIEYTVRQYRDETAPVSTETRYVQFTK